MKITELSVRRPVLITMIYLLVMIIAAVYLSNIQIALYPTVDMPIIGIQVSFDEEADPEQVELQVAKKLENQLSSMENLSSMTSQSSSSSCMVILEFDYGTNLDDAQSDVQDAVNKIKSFPDWVNTPTVMQFDMSQGSTFMRLILTGGDTEEERYTVATDTVKPMFERISGISQVTVRGSTDKEYNIKVDPIRLEAYNLSLSTVTSAISARNTQSTGGTLTQEGMNYQITIDERYTTLDQISDTVITTIGDQPVHLRDIADVVIENTTGGRQDYLNGESVISINLSNDSDSNASTVAAAANAQIPEIEKVLPEGYKLTVQRDETTMISSTMSEVYKSAIEGILLTAIIVFLFLRNFKSTLIICLSMPISILITLAVMSICGITVNSMSMAGLILGIGMIVDASIVILENTVKYREKGRSAVSSAILGSHNMTNAILASTLTTICVFIPLIMFKGKLEMVGMMFQDLIYTVCISLLCSLFVAFTLVPALSGSILQITTRVQKPLKWKFLKRIDDAMARFEVWMENMYAKILAYFLHHKLLLVVLLVVLLMFALSKFSGVGMSLTPSMNTDDSVTASLTLPAGTDNSVTKEELFKVYGTLLDTLPKEAYDNIMVEVGSSNTGSIEIDMPDISEQTYSVSDVKKLVTPLLQGNPDASWVYGGGRGPGSGSAIDVAVSSDNIDDTLSTVKEIANIISTYVPSATNVDTDLADGAPKVTVRIDKERASDLGVSMSSVASILSYALSGKTATQLTTFSSDTTYDLNVTIDDSTMTTIEAVGSLLIPDNDGYVRLDSIATFENGTAPKTITREDKKRVNHVTASAADGYSSSEVESAVESALSQYLLTPDGVTVSQEGEMTDFASYMPTLILIIVLALVLVFAVMAAQFESLIDPFIIFATIPLLLIGVIFIHLSMHQSFSLFSIVGIVALIGTVVNNGIVLVDAINQLVAKKIPVYDACLTAARTRLRPILMSTLTDIIGMVPMAFFPGEGAEMMQPICLTFVGGLATGAFLTLLLSPTLYYVLNKHKEKRYDDPKTLRNQLAAFDAEFPMGRYDV